MAFPPMINNATGLNRIHDFSFVSFLSLSSLIRYLNLTFSRNLRFPLIQIYISQLVNYFSLRRRKTNGWETKSKEGRKIVESFFECARIFRSAWQIERNASKNSDNRLSSQISGVKFRNARIVVKEVLSRREAGHDSQTTCTTICSNKRSNS